MKKWSWQIWDLWKTQSPPGSANVLRCLRSVRLQIILILTLSKFCSLSRCNCAPAHLSRPFIKRRKLIVVLPAEIGYCWGRLFAQNTNWFAMSFTKWYRLFAWIHRVGQPINQSLYRIQIQVSTECFKHTYFQTLSFSNLAPKLLPFRRNRRHFKAINT